MNRRNHLQVFFDEVEAQMQLIRSTHGGVVITRRDTSFVLDGEEYTVIAVDALGIQGHSITFWLGLNKHRLHFITYLNQAHDDCRSRFKPCFADAERVGWEFFYEPLQREMIDGCSVWGTCSTNQVLIRQLDHDEADHGDSHEKQYALTPEGKYWANNIARTVQPLIRTLEHYDIACMDIPPEPL